MSATEAGLSRNAGVAMAVFKQGGRSGAPCPAPRGRVSSDRPQGQLEAGVNPGGARARRRAARAGLPDAGVRTAARQPGVRESLEA